MREGCCQLIDFFCGAGEVVFGETAELGVEVSVTEEGAQFCEVGKRGIVGG